MGVSAPIRGGRRRLRGTDGPCSSKSESPSCKAAQIRTFLRSWFLIIHRAVTAPQSTSAIVQPSIRSPSLQRKIHSRQSPLSDPGQCTARFRRSSLAAPAETILSEANWWAICSAILRIAGFAGSCPGTRRVAASCPLFDYHQRNISDGKAGAGAQGAVSGRRNQRRYRVSGRAGNQEPVCPARQGHARRLPCHFRGTARQLWLSAETPCERCPVLDGHVPLCANTPQDPMAIAHCTSISTWRRSTSQYAPLVVCSLCIDSRLPSSSWTGRSGRPRASCRPTRRPWSA